MKKNFVIFLILSSTLSMVKSQNVITPSQQSPKKDFENIWTEKIYSDSLVSSILIWVKQSVPLHKHVQHSEHVYILEGSADMTIGEDNYSVVAGDLILIPVNTVHSLTVTSPEPIKVISIQAPEFLGKDREIIEQSP